MYNESTIHTKISRLYTTCNRLQNETSFKCRKLFFPSQAIALQSNSLATKSMVSNSYGTNDQLRKECILWRYTNYYNSFFLNKYCTCLYIEKIISFPHFRVQYRNIFYKILHNVTIKMTITDYSSGNNTCFRLHILTSCKNWKWKYLWNEPGNRCKCLYIPKRYCST